MTALRPIRPRSNAGKTTEDHLAWFTRREDELLARAKQLQLELPERLRHWRQWIGDSVIYISELANHVEQAETNKQS